MPFIRTDKSTIKRRGTLDLYADFIDRFYETRSDQFVQAAVVDADLTSHKSVEDGIRKILGSLSPSFVDTPSDIDVFSLGLDSFLVISVIAALRTSTGLVLEFGPQVLYTNPTVEKFAAAIMNLAVEENVV